MISPSGEHIHQYDPITKSLTRYKHSHLLFWLHWLHASSRVVPHRKQWQPPDHSVQDFPFKHSKGPLVTPLKSDLRFDRFTEGWWQVAGGEGDMLPPHHLC